MSPTKVPANLPITFVKATRAESDEALLKSWLRSLGSPHTQRNFDVTARRFLAEFPEGGLRAATVEDVRDALGSMSAGLSEASARQYVLRVKSLLGYAHALGYTPFNAGATIKVRSNAGNALLDELREVVWWASVTGGLSAIGVAVALAATLAI